MDQNNNGYNQPNQGYYNQPNQPNPGYNQPNPGYNQPNPGYNQPNPGYNQPNQPYYNQPGYRAMGNPELAQPVKENVGLGILGALVGSLVGLLATFLLSMANIIASVAGLAGIFCSYWCYKKFSGAKASTLGIIIATVFTVAACLLGLYLGYLFEISKELDVSFSEARELFSIAYDRSSEVRGDFIKDMLMLLLFIALGCIGTISTAAREIKAQKANRR